MQMNNSQKVNDQQGVQAQGLFQEFARGGGGQMRSVWC